MVAQFRTFSQQRVALKRLLDTTTNEVMYGGGARGGKSYLGCGWVLMMALSMPGSKWLVAREELTKLRDTTLLSFFAVAKELQAKEEYTYNATSLTATFSNGSIIFFRELKYIPSDPMFDRLGSYDLTGAFIDEAQQIHPQAINVLRGRFSTLSGPGWRTVPKMLFTCNPAKNWIYTDFYKPHKEGRLPAHKAFVVSLATDNPFISQDYLDNLRRSDKITVERLLHGNFEYDDDPSVLVPYDAIAALLLNEAAAGLPAITVDVARFGSDKSTIWLWNGWRARLVQELQGAGVNVVTAAVKSQMQTHKVPANRTVIDDDGVGGGVRDFIPGSVGFVNNSRALPDPASPPDRATGKRIPENYDNLKSQCKFRMAARMVAGQVQIIDPSPAVWEATAEELAQWKRMEGEDGKLRAVSKDTEKQKLGRSPDYADGLYMRELLELTPAPSGGLAVPRNPVSSLF